MMGPLFLIWLGGFLFSVGVQFLAPGEHHVLPKRWRYVWINLALWPLWWAYAFFFFVRVVKNTKP